ncbi:MAG: hypothetical protein KKE73_05120 [Proteobacteria bacterium]|nr:hypothetical protein [Pseudomonadota bacterium]
MKRMKSFLEREPSLLLLFVLAGLLFGWPLITVAGRGQGLFLYLTVGGAVIIGLLILVAMAHGRDDVRKEEH